MPGAQGIGGEGVGQAEHRHTVLHDGELRGRPGADALGRRIRRLQLGVLRLDGAKLLHELVVFGVGNLGRIQHVVLMVGAVDCVDQLLVLLGELGPFADQRAARGHASSLSGAKKL